MKSKTIDHAGLIEMAAEWLRKKGCAVVITDMAHGGSETPDAIGWRGSYSRLIECKTSRADFLADREKSFRRMAANGMGYQRYFLCPQGMIRPDELPAGWGLLEVGKRVVQSVESQHFYEYAARQEVSLLLSAIRRIGRTKVEGVSVRFYTMTDVKNRATLGVLEELAQA